MRKTRIGVVYEPVAFLGSQILLNLLTYSAVIKGAKKEMTFFTNAELD